VVPQVGEAAPLRNKRPRVAMCDANGNIPGHADSSDSESEDESRGSASAGMDETTGTLPQAAAMAGPDDVAPASPSAASQNNGGGWYDDNMASLWAETDEQLNPARRLAKPFAYSKLFWHRYYQSYVPYCAAVGKQPLSKEVYHANYAKHFEKSKGRAPCPDMCYENFHKKGHSQHDKFVEKMRRGQMKNKNGELLHELVVPVLDTERLEQALEQAIDAFATLFGCLGINSTESLANYFRREWDPNQFERDLRQLNRRSLTAVATSRAKAARKSRNKIVPKWADSPCSASVEDILTTGTNKDTKKLTKADCTAVLRAHGIQIPDRSFSGELDARGEPVKERTNAYHLRLMILGTHSATTCGDGDEGGGGNTDEEAGSGTDEEAGSGSDDAEGEGADDEAEVEDEDADTGKGSRATPGVPTGAIGAAGAGGAAATARGTPPPCGKCPRANLKVMKLVNVEDQSGDMSVCELVEALSNRHGCMSSYGSHDDAVKVVVVHPTPEGGFKALDTLAGSDVTNKCGRSLASFYNKWPMLGSAPTFDYFKERFGDAHFLSAAFDVSDDDNALMVLLLAKVMPSDSSVIPEDRVRVIEGKRLENKERDFQRVHIELIAKDQGTGSKYVDECAQALYERVLATFPDKKDILVTLDALNEKLEAVYKQKKTSVFVRDDLQGERAVVGRLRSACESDHR